MIIGLILLVFGFFLVYGGARELKHGNQFFWEVLFGIGFILFGGWYGIVYDGNVFIVTVIFGGLAIALAQAYLIRKRQRKNHLH